MTAAYQLKNVLVRSQSNNLLDIAELEITQGQSTAILGDNGAGKTTLLQVLAFIQPVSRGEVKMAGQTIQGLPNPETRRRIGLVSQQPYLLPGNVVENLQLSLRLQGIKPARHAAKIDNCLQLLNLQALATVEASKLSGGEQKRVALARALVYDPEILLLDEPFSHLDQRHIQQLESLLRQWASQPGKTVIFSTHDRFQAQLLSDNAISLFRGKRIETPLMNVFHGHCDKSVFDTGNLKITTNPSASEANILAIDPREIIISRTPLNQSSIRNSFPGKLTQITAEANTVRLSIDCGERFEAIITEQSLRELALQLGDQLYVSFKASAVTLI